MYCKGFVNYKIQKKYKIKNNKHSQLYTTTYTALLVEGNVTSFTCNCLRHLFLSLYAWYILTS